MPPEDNKMKPEETSAIETTGEQDVADSTGDVVVMFGRELTNAAQAVVAQLPQKFATRDRRILFHPLPLFNNSIGAHDMGMMDAPTSARGILNGAGSSIRALYVAGSFLPEQLEGHEDALAKLDFLVVQ